MQTADQLRVVVLVSGTGSLLQALLDASAAGDLPVRILAVGSDRPGIQGVARAAAAGVPTFCVQLRSYPDRATWDAALAGAVASHEPDLVVCAGFMKLLGPAFLARFGGRTINTHPALLPSFPGANAVRDALAHGVKVTGCTVFFVDDGVDTGPILAQEAVPVLADDDEGSLHERIKVAERRLLISTVRRLCDAAASGVPNVARPAGSFEPSEPTS